MKNIYHLLRSLSLVGALLISCSVSGSIIGPQSKDLEQSYLIYLNRQVCDHIEWIPHAQDYNTANRNYLSQKAIREFNKKVFDQSLDLSSLLQIWEIVLWFIINILLIGMMFKCFSKVGVSTNMAQKNVVNNLRSQSKIKRFRVILLLIIFALIILFSLNGFSLAQQIKPSTLQQLCSYVVPYAQRYSKTDQYKKQKQIKFQQDAFYYHLKLLNLYQEAAHILRMKKFQLFRSDLTKANQILHNNLFLQQLFNETTNVTHFLFQIVYQTNVFKQFVNYVRVTIKNSKQQLITSFRKLDYYLSKVEFLPGLLAGWFNFIFVSCIISTYFLFKQTYLIYKKNQINREYYHKANIFIRFIIFLALITLLVMLIFENAIFFKCMRKQDFRNHTIYEQYFFNSEAKHSRYQRQYMRKKINHSIPNLQIIQNINIKLSCSKAKQSFQKLQKLFSSNQLVKLDEQIRNKQIQMDSSLTNFIQITQQVQILIGYFKICQQSLEEIISFQYSEIFNYNLSEIGEYEKMTDYQLCEVNLNLIIKINSLLFFLISFFILAFKIFLLNTIQHENSISLRQRELVSIEASNKKNVLVFSDNTENKLYQPFGQQNQRQK